MFSETLLKAMYAVFTLIMLAFSSGPLHAATTYNMYGNLEFAASRSDVDHPTGQRIRDALNNQSAAFSFTLDTSGSDVNPSTNLYERIMPCQQRLALAASQLHPSPLAA